MSATSWRRGPFSQKYVLARELLEARVNLRKVGCKDIGRIAGDPLREINGLIVTAIKDNENTRSFIPDVFNGMTETLWNVGHVSFADIFFAPAPLRTRLRSRYSARCDLRPSD